MMRVTAVTGTMLLLTLLIFAVLPSAEGEPSPSPAAGTTVEESLPEDGPGEGVQELTLQAETPEEGFQIAIALARRGVTETQPDREVLHALRSEYAEDFQALIASSHVVAVHFQTVARANDYWR